MPFDVAGAKAAGYSDAEINAYLANKEAAAPDTTQTGGVNPLVPLGIGVTGLAAAGYGASQLPKLARGAGGAAQRAVTKFAARRVPGVGEAMDVADLVKELRGPGAPPEATAPPPVAEPTVIAEKLPATRARVTDELKARFPKELKNYKAGESISHSLLDKIKTADTLPGSTASRTGLKGQEKTDMRPGYTASGNKQRGKSGPRLVRDAAARAKAVESPPPGSARARTQAPVEAPTDLEQALRASIAGEQAMKARVGGVVDPMARVQAIRNLGLVGGPALEALQLILGGANMQNDMQQAHDVYQNSAHPSAALRRALEGSQGF